jgi:large-conductance mechanosensitive channel/uncharacterized protein YidB (DUF937 family)
MGLLDSLGGALRGVLGQVEADAVPALVSAVLAKTNLGDLQGLVTKLQQGGLGDQVQSWLGNGANLPVTVDQLREALGNEQVQQIARELGLPIDGALKLLAEHLPTVVDQASPNGTLQPSAGGASGVWPVLSSRWGRARSHHRGMRARLRRVPSRSIHGKLTLKEFRDFAMKGNVLDLAIAVVVGAAFTRIVDSLVGDVIMPIVGAIIGGIDFSNYFLPMSKAVTATTLPKPRSKERVGVWEFSHHRCELSDHRVATVSRRESYQPIEAIEGWTFRTTAPSREVALLQEIRDALVKRWGPA